MISSGVTHLEAVYSYPLSGFGNTLQGTARRLRPNPISLSHPLPLALHAHARARTNRDSPFALVNVQNQGVGARGKTEKWDWA